MKKYNKILYETKRNGMETNKTIFTAIISIICLQFAFASPPIWVDEPSDYQFTSTLGAAIVKTDDILISDLDDILAAFDVNGDVRGVAINQIAPATPPNDYTGSAYHEMQIRSNNASDLISFKYYDASEDKILLVAYTYTFVADQLISDLTNFVVMNASTPVYGCMNSAASNYDANANISGCCDLACADIGLFGGSMSCATVFAQGGTCGGLLYGEDVSAACPVSCGGCPAACSICDGVFDCDGVCNGSSVFGGDGCCPAEGCLSIAHDGANIPTKFTIYQNYPNPFNPITNISYELPENINVSIVVYDLYGKQVHSIVNEFQTAGYHSINWNASSYSSGVYFIRIESGVPSSGSGYRFKHTQKVVLIK